MLKKLNQKSVERFLMIKRQDPFNGGELIDVYRDIIASVDRKNMTDSSIMIIMREEIQAYFAGDKSLDEVIEIINNRARTYYGERG